MNDDSNRSDSNPEDALSDPTRHWMALEDARDMMKVAAAVMKRWEDRLRLLSQHLPEPRFAEGTDAPLNLSGAWQGALNTTLDDELRPAIRSLDRAASWTDDPNSWTGDAHGP